MKISLAINSHEPREDWLNQALDQADLFNETILYINSCKETITVDMPDGSKILYSKEPLSITDGFNYAISKCAGEWICSFCDDDYFIGENLDELLNMMEYDGFADDADVIHFPVKVNNGSLWGANTTPNKSNLTKSNLLPHGSFFRKSLFDKLGGYKIDAGADWNLWLRMANAGARFKYYSKPIYVFRTYAGSAMKNQMAELGNDGFHQGVLAHA